MTLEKGDQEKKLSGHRCTYLAAGTKRISFLGKTSSAYSLRLSHQVLSGRFT